MKLQVCLLILLVLNYVLAQNRYSEDIEDNEFAEFEDFEEDDEKANAKERGSTESVHTSKLKPVDGEEGTVEEEDDDDSIVEVI